MSDGGASRKPARRFYPQMSFFHPAGLELEGGGGSVQAVGCLSLLISEVDKYLVACAISSFYCKSRRQGDNAISGPERLSVCLKITEMRLTGGKIADTWLIHQHHYADSQVLSTIGVLSIL